MKALVSLLMPVYNQERFVAESIESAFAQTYSPLEVILSDDRSSDRTFEIAKRMANAYRGPHRIVLNRNKTNLGVTGSINRMMSLAKGELIVAGAGDDIYLPHRIARLCEVWESSGRTATSLHSRVIHVDESGNPIKRPAWELPTEPTDRVIEQPATPSGYVETLKPGVFGCAAAWTPSLFRTFGDLPPGLLFEDNLITFRSVLLGRVLFVDSPLVMYRLHGRNNFNASHDIAVTWESIRDHERRMVRNFTDRASMYRAFQKDLATARRMGKVAEEEYSRACRIAEQKERIFSLQSKFMNGNGAQKIFRLTQLARAGAAAAQLKELAVRLLPSPVFRSAKLFRGWLHGAA